jgi:hypothetical protein
MKEGGLVSHLWHSGLALEASSNTIVDTLRFPPAWVDTFEAIALVTVEAFGVYSVLQLAWFLCCAASRTVVDWRGDTATSAKGPVGPGMGATYASSQLERVS